MQEGLLPPAVLPGGVRLAPQLPLGGQEPLHPHRPPSVDPPGGDAHLRPQAQTEPVGEPRAGVVEDAGGVHGAEELLGVVGVLGDDDVGVAGAVLVDVVDGLLQAADQLDGAGEAAVLEGELGGLRRPEGEGLAEAGAGEYLHTLLLEGLADLGRNR